MEASWHRNKALFLAHLCSLPVMLQEFQLACCEANSYFKSAGCRIKPTLVQLAKSLMAISSKKKKIVFVFFFGVCVCGGGRVWVLGWGEFEVETR